jgi:ATP-binding cassette, subfamily A (ABC1), member 3
MEEAEALATNVAIMGTRMLAKGTLSSLQETYGGQYSVRAVRVDSIGREEVEELVREKFGDRVKGYFDINGQVGFGLPHKKSEMGAIMKIMEGLKVESVADEDVGAGSAGVVGGSSGIKMNGRRVFQDYTINGPTLEEVFMNVARESGTTGVV